LSESLQFLVCMCWAGTIIVYIVYIVCIVFYCIDLIVLPYDTIKMAAVRRLKNISCYSYLC
jgi:hypothetical protein